MNHWGVLNRIILLVLFVSLSSGCAKGLNGSIYLDENSNNSQDGDEVYLAGLTFTVTLDGEEIDTGITDADGNFEVEMDGSGEYCIEVDDSDLETSNVTRVSSLVRPYYQVKAQINRWARRFMRTLPINEAVAQSSATESICDDGIDNDDDGKTDCDDTNCSSDDSCDASDCTATENDLDGVPDCSDSLCDNASVCEDTTDDSEEEDTSTTESGRACKTASGLVLTIDVPIALDYSSTTSDLDDSQTISREVGDSFTIDITYPLTCTLKQLRLPDYLEPTSATINNNYFSESTNKLDLESALAVAHAASSCEDTEAEITSFDDLRTCPLTLSVIDNGVIGEEEETITPMVICPDGETYSLGDFVINKDGDNDITIEIEQTDADDDNTWEAGDAITATITITNNSTVDLDASDFDFEIETPTQAHDQNASISSGSCSGSQSISCRFDLDSDSSIVVTVDYNLPGTISSTTDFQSTATLTVNTNSQAFTETSTITVDN